MKPATWRTYAGVWAAAFVPRLLYLLAARPEFDSPYWQLSTAILRTGSLASDGVPTTAFEPLYPAFLAAARWLTRDHQLMVQAMQAAVAAAGATFLFHLTLALTARRSTAVLAALLFATYPLLIRHAVDASETALFTTCLVAFASAFVAAAGAAGAALAGAYLGLAVLTRATALPLVILAPLMAPDRRRALAVLLVSAGVIAPGAIRNVTVSGAATPARAGINLYLAMSEHTARLFPEYSPDLLGRDEASAIVPPVPARSEQDVDRAYLRLALAELRQHPYQNAWLRIRNVLYFFSPFLTPYRVLTPESRIAVRPDGTYSIENSPPRPLVHRVVYTLSYLPVLIAACAGLYFRRRMLSRDAVLGLVALTLTAVHALFFPTTRYRVPMEFVLLFYAAVGIDAWISGRLRAPRPAN